MNEPEALQRALDEVVNGIYQAYPSLLERYGEAGKQKCREDNQHHLDHLKTAFEVKNEQLFVDYSLWLNDILTARGMKPEHLIDNFERIQSAIQNRTTQEQQAFYQKCLTKSIEALKHI